MKIYNSIDELVGATPLLRAASLSAAAEVLLKLEYLNPAGSIKDRAALGMLNDAERRGIISKGSVIIEPTSGNTGIGLAAIGIPRGYRVILTMPETMSVERRTLLAAYGAELVLTDGSKGMRGAIERAQELAAEIPGSFIPSQFTNPANAEMHYSTTGPEIWEATQGRVDIFAAGVGSAGTIIGTARFLREMNPDIKIVAVEPADSPVLSGGSAGSHGIQGIGAGFVPELLDVGSLDEVITVTTQEAYDAARRLAKDEGILTGISSGAAVHAATVLAGRPENAGKRIVTILPDTGDRYLSTALYSE